MDIKKSYQSLEQLNNFGEGTYNDSLFFLERYGLLKREQNQSIITSNWINYSIQFQAEKDFLFSLLCFKDDYQNYLVEVALLTALRMSEAEDTEGIESFVSSLSVLSLYSISILTEIKEECGFSISKLEERLKQKEQQFQDLTHLIFGVFPLYTRVISYLKYVQAYKQEDTKEDIVIGKKVDEQWQKGERFQRIFLLFP